jgi:hypothetical protein|tara:strand:+ start:8014 stop:9033 length:1020 start_codon:yes stop_codon:yes gene_type:complete
MSKVIFPCNLFDLKNLKNYLKNNWVKDHILLRSKKIFNWYYQERKNYNFIYSKKNKIITSCLGIIPNKKIEKNDKSIFDIKNQIIWLTMWSVDKRIKHNSGLDLLFFVMKKAKKSIIATVGCNKNSFNIFRSLGFKCSFLKHYYFINPKKKFFNLINIKNIKTYNYKKTKKKLFLLDFMKSYSKIKNIDILEKKFKKDYFYFFDKYLKNPFYIYKFFFYKDMNIEGFFVAREAKHNLFKSLRIVEFFGNYEKLENLTYDLRNISINNNYEYIDFYNYGIPSKILTNLGFMMNTYKKEIIIPNYYEPFILKNIKLAFSFFPPNSKIYLFKGDCDQERPNN